MDMKKKFLGVLFLSQRFWDCGREYKYFNLNNQYFIVYIIYIYIYFFHHNVI